MFEELKKAYQDHWKRYVISSSLTFVGAFALALYTQLQSVGSEDVISSSFIFGILSVCFRDGLKALWELAINWFNEYKESKTPHVSENTPPPADPQM